VAMATQEWLILQVSRIRCVSMSMLHTNHWQCQVSVQPAVGDGLQECQRFFMQVHKITATSHAC
jgi:hypothetical protein